MRVKTALLPCLVAATLHGCGATGVTCGDGFAEDDGRCVFSCGELCGAHEQCVETARGGQCECVAGYSGAPCEWSGVIEDPDFLNSDLWSKQAGAVVLGSATRGTDVERTGFASFASEVICDAGSVSQVVEMPPYELAEPLVISTAYAVERTTIAVGYNRAFRRLRGFENLFPFLNEERICLGEAGYGGQVKFQVAAEEQILACVTSPEGRFEVDRLQILPAEEGECPAPGEVLNGSATPGEGGWEFEEETFFEGMPDARLTERGARIYKPAGSANWAAMHTKASVPFSVDGQPPALRFEWEGDGSSWWYVALGTYPGVRNERDTLDSLSGTGSVETYCLPPRTHGSVVELAFAIQSSRLEDEAELIVKDVSIVGEPACGNDSDLLDPGFDSAPLPWPGVREQRPAAGTPASLVQLINDSERAQGEGTGLLELRYTNSQARIESQHWVWVPAAEGDRKPQVWFYSHIPEDTGADVFWFLGTYGRTTECDEPTCPLAPLSRRLRSGGGWRLNKVCLPVEFAERWYVVRIGVRPRQDEPIEFYDPPKSVLLDDFSVEVDEGCP